MPTILATIDYHFWLSFFRAGGILLQKHFSIFLNFYQLIHTGPRNLLNSLCFYLASLKILGIIPLTHYIFFAVAREVCRVFSNITTGF